MTHQLNLQRHKWFSIKAGHLLQGRIMGHVSSQPAEKSHASHPFLLTHLNTERQFEWTQSTSGGSLWTFQTNERAKIVQLLTEGSSEIILTVLSTSPTARKRERCSPGGTLARLMQTTSADISFLSVYSFSCPDWGRKTYDFLIRYVVFKQCFGFVI